MTELKKGTRVVVAKEWYKQHSGINKATVVGKQEGNTDYHITFDNCNCQSCEMPDGGHCCGLFSECWLTVDFEETQKVREASNKHAASLAEWMKE